MEVELKAQFLVDGLVDPQIDLKDLFLKLVAVLIQLFDGLVDFHDVLADLLLPLALALAVLGHRKHLVVQGLLELLALLLEGSNFVGLFKDLVLVAQVLSVKGSAILLKSLNLPAKGFDLRRLVLNGAPRGFYEFTHVELAVAHLADVVARP